MQYLSDNKIENKRVIVRCDLNVSIKKEKILDDSKIIRSLKTINYLLDNNNTVIILSHFGRIKEESDKENNSLYIVYEYLKKYIDISFIKDPFHLEKININNSKCYLIENTRFTDIPNKMESANNLELAKYWASFADVFVNDAFASLHRAHTSTAGLSKYLKTYYGFLVEEELNNLKDLINNTTHPFVVIMGGAKVDDKIKIIKGILKKCDKLVLTGGILNTFLKVSGKNIGKSLSSSNEDVLNEVKDILNEYENKIYFTNKFIVKDNNYNKIISIEEIKDNDIIYDNIVNIKDIVKEAEIIFLNGTCGKYEEEIYRKGTFTLLNDLKNSSKKVIVGGGDAVTAVTSLGFKDNFYYLSSGGGATLEYVAFNKLNAIEWTQENNVDKY